MKAPWLSHHVGQRRDLEMCLVHTTADHGARKARVYKILHTAIHFRQPLYLPQRFHSLRKQHCQLNTKCSSMRAREEHVTFTELKGDFHLTGRSRL